ncbi:hypothetical protein QBC37DRAFT_373028 [Rhypophila decipiens]|uniref:Uncharacterized protein n=1 Tax=Rhypophila decipiens TaxID=261697 RepID=A0AAN6YD38_9PEZI|nr:hypothetical protein QBC37DRAFT_373028 [Rhypophila decipiens]
MDEKRVRDMSPIRLGRATSRRQLPTTILAVTLITMSLYAWSHLAGLTQLATGHQWQQPVQPVVNMNTLVPLEAHIMSKCGDAKDCLKHMVLPAMQRVYDKVNFTLSFIGTPTENDGVACRHGPEECLGNIIELCAQKLYPDPKTYLGFTMCLTKDYDMIPQRSLVEDCALEHAIDFDKLNECATKDDGAFGMGMLRGSVKRSSDVGTLNLPSTNFTQSKY